MTVAVDSDRSMHRRRTTQKQIYKEFQESQPERIDSTGERYHRGELLAS